MQQKSCILFLSDVLGVEEQPILESPANPGITVCAKHAAAQQKPLLFNDLRFSLQRETAG